VSFANPGGFIIGAAIAIVLLGGRYGLPFVGDYLKSRQSGVGQAKAQRKLRDTMRRNDDEEPMSTLNSLLMILVPIGVAFAAGHLLFQRRGSGAVAATSAYGTVMGTFWTLVGVFMIIGGLQIIGGLIIAVAWYLARGNYKRYKQEGGLRAALNG